MSAAPRRARVLPVLVVAFAAIAMLRAGGLAVEWSGARAEQATAAPPQSPRAPQTALDERIANRDAALDAREAELSTRAALLAAAEARLEGRLAQLAAAETQFETRAAAENDRRKAEIAALSNAYEKMRPKDAARIFEALEDDILVPVAAGMRVQSLAGVLAEMSPQRARALTNALANRNVAAAEGGAP